MKTSPVRSTVKSEECAIMHRSYRFSLLFRFEAVIWSTFESYCQFSEHRDVVLLKLRNSETPAVLLGIAGLFLTLSPDSVQAHGKRRASTHTKNKEVKPTSPFHCVKSTSTCTKITTCHGRYRPSRVSRSNCNHHSKQSEETERAKQKWFLPSRQISS